RCQAARDVHDRVIVEVDTGDGPVRARHPRLLLETERSPVGVEFDDAVSLGIVHVIRKELRPGAQLRGPFERGDEIISIKNVVAKDEADWGPIDKVCTDDEGLRDPSGTRLLEIREAHSNFASIVE